MAMKKVAVVTADIGMILAMFLPVVCLLSECFDSAVNGVVPSGFGYGLTGDKLIYGAEAFFNTMAFYLYFGFVFVFMWIAWIVLTFAFTVFTVIYVRRKK